MIHPKYKELLEQQEQLLTRQNEIDPAFYNGVYDRYRYPVITRHHVPLHWRFDLDETTNPISWSAWALTLHLIREPSTSMANT